MLELRHDETDEVFVSSGNVGCGNNEPVAGTLDQPLFELVGNLLRAADDWIVNPPAAAEVEEITHRRVPIPAGTHHAVADRLETGNISHVLIRERVVHAFGREIKVEGLRQQREPVDFERQLLYERPFVFSLHLGGGGNNVDELCDLDVLRIAAEAHYLRLEISIVALADLDVRVEHEDQLAPLRPEGLAPTTLPVLDDDGVAMS